MRIYEYTLKLAEDNNIELSDNEIAQDKGVWISFPITQKELDDLLPSGAISFSVLRLYRDNQQRGF